MLRDTSASHLQNPKTAKPILRTTRAAEKRKKVDCSSRLGSAPVYRVEVVDL